MMARWRQVDDGGCHGCDREIWGSHLRAYLTWVRERDRDQKARKKN